MTFWSAIKIAVSGKLVPAAQKIGLAVVSGAVTVVSAVMKVVSAIVDYVSVAVDYMTAVVKVLSAAVTFMGLVLQALVYAYEGLKKWAANSLQGRRLGIFFGRYLNRLASYPWLATQMGLTSGGYFDFVLCRPWLQVLCQWGFVYAMVFHILGKSGDYYRKGNYDFNRTIHQWARQFSSKRQTA